MPKSMTLKEKIDIEESRFNTSQGKEWCQGLAPYKAKIDWKRRYNHELLIAKNASILGS